VNLNLKRIRAVQSLADLLLNPIQNLPQHFTLLLLIHTRILPQISSVVNIIHKGLWITAHVPQVLVQQHRLSGQRWSIAVVFGLQHLMPHYDHFRRSSAPPQADDDLPAAPRILHRLPGLGYEPSHCVSHPLWHRQLFAVII
jgi:hypothetical protein